MYLLFSIRELNDHLFGKELPNRFTVRVFRERLSILVCVLLNIWLHSFLIIALLFTLYEYDSFVISLSKLNRLSNSKIHLLYKFWKKKVIRKVSWQWQALTRLWLYR